MPKKIDRSSSLSSDNNDDDVPVATVVQDLQGTIVAGTADDHTLSQEDLLSTQDFSTTVSNSLQATASCPAPLPAVPKIPELPIGKPAPKRTRISFKSQGIEGTKNLFVNHDVTPQSVIDMIPSDYYVTGLVTDVPSAQNNHQYTVVWEDTQLPPSVSGNKNFIRTTIIKNDSNFKYMKIARLCYDDEHLFGPPTHLVQNGTETKTSKRKATKISNSAVSTMKPVSEADVAVTTIRMLPLPMPDAHTVNVHPTSENVDSESDEERER